jgi:hypothetical protein
LEFLAAAETATTAAVLQPRKMMMNSTSAGVAKTATGGASALVSSVLRVTVGKATTAATTGTDEEAPQAVGEAAWFGGCRFLVAVP